MLTIAIILTLLILLPAASLSWGDDSRDFRPNWR